MKTVILMMFLALTACGNKAADVAAELAKGVPSPGPGPGPNLDGPAAGTLKSKLFGAKMAVIKAPSVSDDARDYYRIYVTDIMMSNPCNQIAMADRFVAFYISKNAPLGRFDMSVRRGATTGALFYDYASGVTYAEWVSTGWVDVNSFDTVNGASLSLNINGDPDNGLYGKIHASYCP
jgi:hypothetical protein